MADERFHRSYTALYGEAEYQRIYGYRQKTEQEYKSCPRCGELMTDACDPNFCEGCFQDYPMHSAWMGDWEG